MVENSFHHCEYRFSLKGQCALAMANCEGWVAGESIRPGQYFSTKAFIQTPMESENMKFYYSFATFSPAQILFDKSDYIASKCD